MSIRCGMLWLLLACTAPLDDPSRPGPIGSVVGDATAADTATDPPTGGTAPTGRPTQLSGATAVTADTAPPRPTFDCRQVPEQPGVEVMLDGPRGYNDVVFLDDGDLVGSDESALLRSATAADREVFVPGVGQIYKLDCLPDGDLVMSRSESAGGGVLRVTPDGGQTVLAAGLLGHGMAVGPHGAIWLATNYTAGAEAIFRIDPATGDAELMVDATFAPPRDIAFHPDGTRLYWGTLNGGEIWGVTLDASGAPLPDAQLVATVPEGWHDTVEVDACGNLYVGSVFESAIYRVFTDGRLQLLADWSFDDYGHGLAWGEGGAWDEQTIYVAHPYVGSRVSELFLGVPGPRWDGEVTHSGRL